MASIYGLYDPRDGRIRYVGVTIQPLHKRLYGHVNDAKKEKNHRANWIRSLRKQGVNPMIRLLEDCPYDEDRFSLEREWIHLLRECGDDLVNGTDGGENPPIRRKEDGNRGGRGRPKGWNHTPETRAILKITRQNQVIAPWTEEQWERHAETVAAREFCGNGHDLTDPKNVGHRPKSGKYKGSGLVARFCRICKSEWDKEQRRRDKAEKKAIQESGVTTAEVRAWGVANGFGVGRNGPVHLEVFQAYVAANWEVAA